MASYKQHSLFMYRRRYIVVDLTDVVYDGGEAWYKCHGSLVDNGDGYLAVDQVLCNSVPRIVEDELNDHCQPVTWEAFWGIRN